MDILKTLEKLNIDLFDFISILEFTPDKSKIISKGNTIKIKYIGKKGVLKARNSCTECRYLSFVQMGLGVNIAPCCCKVDGEWRELRGWTERKCNAFIKKALF